MRATEAVEGQGGSSQVVQLKAIQAILVASGITEWPTLYLYNES